MVRVLDLDLVLVPRGLVPVVRALVRDYRGRTSSAGGTSERSLYAEAEDEDDPDAPRRELA